MRLRNGIGVLFAFNRFNLLFYLEVGARFRGICSEAGNWQTFSLPLKSFVVGSQPLTT